MRKIKWNMIFGILVMVTFFSLLLVRLELLQKKDVSNIQISQSKQPQDIWMHISQNDQKIGFVHRTFSKKDDRFLFNENVVMKINMMGIHQALNIMTEGE